MTIDCLCSFSALARSAVSFIVVAGVVFPRFPDDFEAADCEIVVRAFVSTDVTSPTLTNIDRHDAIPNPPIVFRIFKCPL
jgi:hypothetical protein